MMITEECSHTQQQQTHTHTHREGKEHTKENGHRDKASKAQQKKKHKSFKITKTLRTTLRGDKK
jgi:hypothetical protein